MQVIDKMEVKLENAFKNRAKIDSSIVNFSIHAPIFVIRDLLRYIPPGTTVFEPGQVDDPVEPTFYMPSSNRGIVKIDNQLFPGEMRDYTTVHTNLAKSYELAWTVYEALVEYGVAQEIARMSLPSSIYTKIQVTGDLHSLSLITKSGSPLAETIIIIQEIKRYIDEMRK